MAGNLNWGAARRSILGSFFGMVLESYDFLVYSAVTATVFGPLFFPSTDKFTSMLLALGTFGAGRHAGFVMRPLGGIFFGHYGDKVGRKPMMIVSLAMIGGSTTLIGFLPTYEQVGITAPIMLLTLRLVQGFAFGGELGGSILMAIEHAPLHRKGFVGSLPTAAVPLGLVLATLLILLSSTIAGDQYLVWGWRLPFFARVCHVRDRNLRSTLLHRNTRISGRSRRAQRAKDSASRSFASVSEGSDPHHRNIYGQPS